MSRIALTGMEFFAHHGYYVDERQRGKNYLLDVEINYDMEKAADTDDLDNALNYEEVYTICKSEMDDPRHLIEAVAKGIASKVVGKFPFVDYVIVRLTKLKPEVGGPVESSRVEYYMKGEQQDYR